MHSKHSAIYYEFFSSLWRVHVNRPLPILDKVMLHSSSTLHLKMSTHFACVNLFPQNTPWIRLHVPFFLTMEKMKHRNDWQGRSTSPLYFFATMSLGKSLAQFKVVSSLLLGTELTYKLLLPLQELRGTERYIFCPTLWKKCSTPPKGPETEYPMWLSSFLEIKSAKETDWGPGAGSESEVQCPCFFVTLPFLWITLWIKQSADYRIVLTSFHLF